MNCAGDKSLLCAPQASPSGGECERGLVSVIIPTHNRVGLLAEAAKSVLAQTYRPIELLVVDDGSTDGTENVVQSWREGLPRHDNMRIHYIYQPNKGANSARNLGLRASHGEFVLFHDSDDILDSRRIQLQVAKLTGGLADMCSGSFVSMPAGISDYRCPDHSDDVMLDFLRNRVHGGTPCWMIRRNLALAVGGLDESLVCYQDYDLTFRLLAQCPRVAFEPEATTAIREHEGARVSRNRYTREGMQSILHIHTKWVRVLTERFNSQKYLDAENQWVLRFAIRASARGFHEIARQFHSLSDQLHSRCLPGSTWARRVILQVGGVRGCGLLMRFAKKRDWF